VLKKNPVDSVQVIDAIKADQMSLESICAAANSRKQKLEVVVVDTVVERQNLVNACNAPPVDFNITTFKDRAFVSTVLLPLWPAPAHASNSRTEDNKNSPAGLGLPRL
jgi:hypothetical protein